MKANATFFRIAITLWCWLVSLTFTSGARILGIFPLPAKSHFSCNEAMMRSLHNAGHEITFVSPFVGDESLKNYSVIDTKRNIPIYIGISSIREFSDRSFFDSIVHVIEQETEICKDVLGSSEIQTLMKSKEKQYDVMFIEFVFMFQCYLPLAEKLNIPVIGTVTARSWILADAVIGNPNNPAAVPLELTTFSDKMTFLERVENLWKGLYIHYKFNFNVPKKLNEVYNQFFSPDLLNKKQVSLVFTNKHFSLSSRPTVPNMIDVGGIHVQPAKSLPKVID